MVEGHDAAAEETRLRWNGRLLAAAHAPGFAPGAVVDWVVAPSHVLLHRRGRPSFGERENPVPGRVAEALALRDTTRVTLDVGDPDGGALVLSLPTHAATRNGVTAGVEVTVSLLRDGIHLMAPKVR